MSPRPSPGPVGSPAIELLDVLAQGAIFSALPQADLATLLAASTLERLPPESPMLPGLEPDGARVAPIPYVLIVEGMAKVSGVIQGVEKVLNTVDRGEIFNHYAYSDEERLEIGLTAMSPVEALMIPISKADQLMDRHPAFKQAFEASQALGQARRERWFIDPRKARMASFVVEERLLPTNRVKVLRHDLCVECDACYEACADRHGVSRLWPSEVRLGVIQIPYNCHNCHYPTCEPACRFDVLRYDEDEPELRVSHDCVGCQQCARACSYGAITMVPFDAIDPSYMSQRSDDARGGRMYSVKCDNCAGYGDLACISACPTGALFQVDGAALLDLLEGLDEKGTRARVLDRLNPEPLPLYKSLSWTLFIFTTIAASWEVIGRYLVPEYTAMALFEMIDPVYVRQTEFLYRYRAGEDLSMLYGYLAAGLAVGGQLYRVRKWMGRFGGDLRVWLQWHIITSMLGVMFAFWHLALNFFNLPGIAWWAFCVVIVSGMVGTWLHTFVPLGQAGKELALEHLQARLATLNKDIDAFHASRGKAKLAVSSKPSGATKLTRLQDLKMLAGGDSEFLTGVFKLVMADLASLKDRDQVQRAAFRRAGVTGDKKRQMEKLLSQRTRIEGGIALYEKIRGYSRQWLSVHRAASYIFFVALSLHVAFELIW